MYSLLEAYSNLQKKISNLTGNAHLNGKLLCIVYSINWHFILVNNCNKVRYLFLNIIIDFIS